MVVEAGESSQPPLEGAGRSHIRLRNCLLDSHSELNVPGGQVDLEEIRAALSQVAGSHVEDPLATGEAER